MSDNMPMQEPSQALSRSAGQPKAAPVPVEDLLRGESLFPREGSSLDRQRLVPTTAITRILRADEIDAAVDLFKRSPGWEDYAEDFRKDAARFLSDSPSAVYGVFEDRVTPKGEACSTIVGVGILIREQWDFAYWAVTWVMVDPNMRGKGYGERLMDAILDHAKHHQATTTNPNTRVLLSAVDEAATRFYEKLGFKTLLPGPIPNGECLMYRDVTGPGLPLLE